MHSKRYWERVAERDALMKSMMQKLDVHETDVGNIDGGLALWAAQTKCMFCPDLEACRSWLAGDAQAPHPDAFCPNHSLFDGVRKSGE